ncbi:Uncharacterized conserved protein YtfP, gamma-glutamylcyclotransferase (GGCT)/AIG2-like family [Bryocella elongata]|uniref:Uncharacterized conserved protein YtfP, gamma-glutamylcyclotransferase (GGCT)/AIG2-like family n=1 Tax=Bryocella elongata TaxID=863522 RepID=A0A1H5YJN2_9BACT|nr:gamma-glutamylcyclotransferase family protein [Bryocella elongata]SEG24268.1 Uncharacterized conserved protein YtfP, gamma-glutamylcyclotransferase (GGCT)/AIG2-like family [Bryocella elongata]
MAEPIDNLIFVYGTLHPDRSPAEIVQVTRRFELVGEGTIEARKYQFQHYPAIVLGDLGLVAGHVFRVPDPEMWAAIDRYEGYYPTRHDTSLFVRTRTLVTMNDGSKLEAWVYEYGRRMPVKSRA